MEPTKAAELPARMLDDPDGKPLGRVMAPRPGPVVGRASGTVYLVRSWRATGSAALPPERGYASGRR